MSKSTVKLGDFDHLLMFFFIISIRNGEAKCNMTFSWEHCSSDIWCTYCKNYILVLFFTYLAAINKWWKSHHSSLLAFFSVLFTQSFPWFWQQSFWIGILLQICQALTLLSSYISNYTLGLCSVLFILLKQSSSVRFDETCTLLFMTAQVIIGTMFL